ASGVGDRGIGRKIGARVAVIVDAVVAGRTPRAAALLAGIHGTRAAGIGHGGIDVVVDAAIAVIVGTVVAGGRPLFACIGEAAATRIAAGGPPVDRAVGIVVDAIIARRRAV